MSQVKLEIDLMANAGYIRLSEEEIHRSVQVTEDVLIDLDVMNIAVGIEVLTLSATIPFIRLVDDFHIHTDVIEMVRRIQPSISGVSDLSQGSEGATESKSISSNPVSA